MKFPKFLIRDMVASQKLLLDHLGIEHLVAVIGPSMGGMQTLQWRVSYPDMMDSLVAIVPLAKTPGWTVAVLEASRKAIILDPAWKNGDVHDAPSEPGGEEHSIWSGIGRGKFPAIAPQRSSRLISRYSRRPCSGGAS